MGKLSELKIKNISLKAICTILLVLLVGCDQSLDSQIQRLENFVTNNKYGSNSDYWLVKKNMFGDTEKVALVFGFMGDDEFCADIASLYMKKYPDSKYFCAVAN